MIRGVNTKEALLIPNVSATVPPHAPTTTATVLRFVMPKSGKLKAVTCIVAAAGTAGNSTDLKETLKVNKRGVTGAVSAVAISAEVSLVDLNLTPDLILASGTVVNLPGLSGNRAVKGEICDLVWTETGTLGTATRATFSVLGIEFEADSNISPSVN